MGFFPVTYYKNINLSIVQNCKDQNTQNYKSIILLVVLYGCETLSFASSEGLKEIWGAEENIWTKEWGSNGKLENTAGCTVLQFYLLDQQYVMVE